MANEKRTDNRVTSLIGVSNVDSSTPVAIEADPTTKRLLVNATLTGSSGDGAILDGVTSSIKATVFSYTNSKPIAVRLSDTNGDFVSAGAGTQYTEDVAAAADPIGNALIMVRADTLAAITSTDGDNVAMRGTNKGELYVKQTDSVPVTIASGGVASGAFASGAIASGAISSGAIASGAIASGAVASGAFAAGSIAAGAIATGATSIAANEDDASANLDTGVKILAIQQSTPADTAGTNGDYVMLQMSAGRLWTSTSLPSGAVASGAIASGAFASGSIGSGAIASGAVASGAFASGSIGSGAVASGAIASGAVASGAFASGSIASGAIVAGAIAAGASSLVKLEDAASADADAGVPAMAIQKATPADTAGTDGDYAMLQMSAGRLWTASQSSGDVAHDGVDAGNPVKVGMRAIAHGTNPTAVAAADRTDWLANVAGVPFVMGGHPNIITLEAAYTTAQTDTAIITVAGGAKIVITEIEALCDNANTVNVAVRIGFAAATTPTTTGVVLTHPGIAAGSGVVRGTGAGILGVGADGEDLRITSGVPTTGSIRILVSYFTITV